MTDLETFVPDTWLYVEAKSEQAARSFFGAPENHPVKFHKFKENSPGKIYKVLSAGFQIS